jgi:hypothetical protein
MEAVLSLQHIFRVARAVGIDPARGIECAVVYIVDEGDVEIVAETWNGEGIFEDVPPLAIVVVDGLPRGAKVEWHVIRCRKFGEEEEREVKSRMAFEQHEVITAINEFQGDHGVLCMIFGSSQHHKALQSRYTNLAIQIIPSRAIYSMSNNKITQQSSCTIILAD